MKDLDLDKECFIKITNKDIYQEIVLLRQDFNLIRSKVKINTWCSATALSLVVGILVGMLIK